MKKTISFLERYTKQVNSSIKSNRDFKDLYYALQNNKIKSHIRFNYEEAYKEALEYKKLLDRIISIVFKPHIKVTTEDVIIRSELSNSLSPNSLKDTIRDTRLWKNKRGVITPEYVHNEQFIDTIITYENNFIAMLIDIVDKHLKEMSYNLLPLVKSIEEEYEIKGLNYGKRSFLNEFAPFKQPFENVFKKEKTNSQKVYNLLLKLIKRVKNIKSSEFYRFNKNKFKSNVVEPTNILVHDILYSYCYRFYLDNFLTSSKDEEQKRDTLYYNYVISQLVSYIASYNVGKGKTNFSKQLYFKDDKLHFKEFGFKKGLYSFIVKEISEMNAISVEVRLINKSIRYNTSISEDKISKYLLLTSYKYDKTNKPYIDAILEKEKDNYSSIILITQINVLLEFINTCNISIYNSDNMTLIKNLISSFTLLFDTDTEIYVHKCPVCGGREILIDNKNYVCQNCLAKYALLEIENVPMLWVKSLRRK